MAFAAVSLHTFFYPYLVSPLSILVKDLMIDVLCGEPDKLGMDIRSNICIVLEIAQPNRLNSIY